MSDHARRPAHEGYSEFAPGKHEYRLHLTVCEMNELWWALAEKEQRLTTSPPTTKDLPGNYRHWDKGKGHDSQIAYDSHSRVGHSMQSLPCNGVCVAQYGVNDDDDDDIGGCFATQPEPESTKDPYPGQGVVVQGVVVQSALLHPS